MKLNAMIVAAAAAIPSTAFAKPLLQGTYEIEKVRGPDGKEQAVAGSAKPPRVWARMALAFDGDTVTFSTASLALEDGKYTGCEAEVSEDVMWTKSGFTVAAHVGSHGRVTQFAKLTSTDAKTDATECAIDLDKGTYAVTAGAAPTLKKDGGTIYLAPTDEADKISWSKHVK